MRLRKTLLAITALGSMLVLGFMPLGAGAGPGDYTVLARVFCLLALVVLQIAGALILQFSIAEVSVHGAPSFLTALILHAILTVLSIIVGVIILLGIIGTLRN